MKNLAAMLVLCILIFPYAEAGMQSSFIEAGEFSVQRIAPEKAVIGQKVWVSFIIENRGKAVKEIRLKERLSNAEFEKNTAKYIETEYREKMYYYEWKIRLKPKEKTIISYWLIPDKLGRHALLASEIITGNERMFLESRAIEIMCRADNVCSAGENYLTCAEDCATGIKDNICDFAEDGKCDEDCEKESDKDCMAEEQKISIWKVNIPPYIKAILKKAIQSRVVGFFIKSIG